MSVTKEDVQYIAELARLRLDVKEAESIQKDLNQILGYMKKLEELDTTNVEPLEHVLEMEFRTRKDVPEPPLSHEEAMKNAPDADSDYFRVPKVIE